MKICLLASPWLKVPPDGYGGSEWIVYYLAEGLVKRGHDVTLFATGDSHTSAQLKYVYKHALGNNLKEKLNPYLAVNHYYHFMKNTLPAGFDIIHNHSGRGALFFLDLQHTPFVHTLHGNYTSEHDTLMQITGGMKMLEQFKDHPFVSISRRQQTEMPSLQYAGNVYNGVDTQKYTFNPSGAEPIVWLGRVAKIKGIDLVLHISRQTHKPVRFGGWIDEGDRSFFELSVKPNITKDVTYIGELHSYEQKSALFGQAKLFLAPLMWEEPFGLVLVEAMACGTPVVAYARGSAPELIIDGVTGYLVNPSETDIRGDFIIKKTGMTGLQEAVNKLYSLAPHEYHQMRRACRTHVQQKFSIQTMVDEYEKIYKKLLT